MKYVFDADLVYGQPARVGTALDIFDGRHVGFLGGGGDVHFALGFLQMRDQARHGAETAKFNDLRRFPPALDAARRRPMAVPW
jgi:hypothetical protein